MKLKLLNIRLDLILNLLRQQFLYYWVSDVLAVADVVAEEVAVGWVYRHRAIDRAVSLSGIGMTFDS